MQWGAIAQKTYVLPQPARMSTQPLVPSGPLAYLTPPEIVATLEQKFSEQDWSFLVQCMSSPVKISYDKQVEWATTPTTAGTLSIKLLADHSLNNRGDLTSYASQVLPFVLELIRFGTDDQRENAMMLLLGYLRGRGAGVKELLLRLDMFNAVGRYFLCSNEDLRMSVAQACYMLYRDEPTGMQEFVNKKYMNLLIQLISRSFHNEDDLVLLLEYLGELIGDLTFCEKTDLQYRLKQAMAERLFEDIKNRPFCFYNKDKVKRILRMATELLES